MGPYLSSPNTKKDNHSGEGTYNNGKKFVWASATMQGWRNTMEDAHIFATNIDNTDVSVFGVFDGHGGAEVAKFVEKNFIQQLKNTQEFKAGKYGEALTNTFYKMDEMLETTEGQKELQNIKKAGGSNGGMGYPDEKSYAGCTANVLLIAKDKVFVANAGDSRSVLCQGSSNQAYPLSEDHKPDQEREKKRINDAGGFVSDGRVNANLNLSRAIGDLEYKTQKNIARDKQLIIATPDIKEYQLTADDKFVLMGCDGIWEVKSNQQLVDTIRQKLPTTAPQQILNELLDELLAPDTSNGVGCDNMSSIIVVFKQ